MEVSVLIPNEQDTGSHEKHSGHGTKKGKLWELGPKYSFCWLHYHSCMLPILTHIGVFDAFVLNLVRDDDAVWWRRFLPPKSHCAKGFIQHFHHELQAVHIVCTDWNKTTASNKRTCALNGAVTTQMSLCKITGLTCILDMKPSNLSWHTAVPTDYSWSSSIPPVKCWESTLNYTMPVSFHILSGSLFTIIKTFDTIQSQLLTASLNELQITIQMWLRYCTHSVHFPPIE